MSRGLWGGPRWFMHRTQPEPWHNSPDPLVSPLLGTVSSSPPRTGTGAGSHLPTREMSPRARDARGAAAKPPDPPQASQHGRRLERQRGERRGEPGAGAQGKGPREPGSPGRGAGPEGGRRPGAASEQSPGLTQRGSAAPRRRRSAGADGSSGATEMKGSTEKGNILGVGKHCAAQTILLVNWQPATRLITKLLYGQEKNNVTAEQFVFLPKCTPC